MNSSKPIGRIIIPSGTNPWQHELRLAKILSAEGYVVEFIPCGITKTADVYLNGVEFEIKSPITSQPEKIVRNVKRALEKCQNVIIGSSRIKGVQDNTLIKLLKNRAKDQKRLKKLLFVTKRGMIIDILSLD